MLTKTKKNNKYKKRNTQKIQKKTQKKTQKKKEIIKGKKKYDKEDYSSGDGMLTTIWGPSMWHYLHTMSFNYPVKPTTDDKTNYRNFTKCITL